MQIDIFIQARMSSTRLPGKVMKTVLDKPLISYVFERAAAVQNVRNCLVLTTEDSTDDGLVQFCQDCQIPVFRGPLDDVLTRYYQAAVEKEPDAIVRITADCPLIDPSIINRVIEVYKTEFPCWDYVSNTLERTYPRGMDVEVFSAEALEQAFYAAKRMEEREHVTLYMYRHPDLFYLKNVAAQPAFPSYRLTVDTPEDFELIRRLIQELYPQDPCFGLEKIVETLNQHPEWAEINQHIEQKKI
jgi:spore coat polysaccharide biosynthesis protein SpsF